MNKPKATPRKGKQSSKKQPESPINKRGTSDQATVISQRSVPESDQAEAQIPPFPPPQALTSQAAFQAWLKTLPPPPESFTIGQDLDWNAPWVEVTLRLELPFWLMVDNTAASVSVGGHEFPVSLHGETLNELHVGHIVIRKRQLFITGQSEKQNLSTGIKALLRKRPKLNPLWRKCKTTVKITSRCNEDAGISGPAGNRFDHLSPFICNACAERIFRSSTSSYKATVWPHMIISFLKLPLGTCPIGMSSGMEIRHCAFLVPYREWDHKPVSLVAGPDGRRQFYRLIEPSQLYATMSEIPTPGELELLDAINLMERGNYSDAVRRITTAIEVIVEAVTGDLVEQHEGKQPAAEEA